MKIISWNVNGLRAVVGKNFYEFVAESNADIICLQETKMQEGQLQMQMDGYYQYWNSAEKKGYSGTAIFSKIMPISCKIGLDEAMFNNEGRVITLEFADFYLVNCYTPNSQDKLARIDYRMAWEDYFYDYLCQLDATKPVILCGDLNVAHQEIDLKNPKPNIGNPGFSPQERDKMTRMLSTNFCDSFRALYPEKIKYSWWSYRFSARQKNIGWRIDYFILSNRLFDKLEDSLILDEVLGSDHCPVGIVLK